jgi:2-keto-3-deoxy-L-fuconate dehydrogenase
MAMQPCHPGWNSSSNPDFRSPSLLRIVAPSTMFSLKGKTAIVTGGGSGIGQAISTVFAKAGAKVEILEMSEAAAKETVASIESEGGKADFSICDVSKEADVRTTIDAIAARNEGINILVNNAGVASIGDAISTTEDEFDRIYAVNVKGVRNCLHFALPKLQDAGGGVVLNMASTVSLMGIDDRFAYSMSKGAVLTMTYSVARDFMKHGIRCNCICPARIHTPFVDGYLDKNYPDNREEMFEKLSLAQPIGRMGKPVEVAYAALFLCSDESSFITGTAYPVDGGTVNIR